MCQRKVNPGKQIFQEFTGENSMTIYLFMLIRTNSLEKIFLPNLDSPPPIKPPLAYFFFPTLLPL